MKKALLILTATVLTTLYTFAQQNGVAAAAAAQKALTAYNLDPSKSDKLKEAINLIEKALKSRDAQNLSSAWLTKAEIYNTRLQMDMAKKIIDPNAKLSDENDALISFEAYKKCLSLSDKKSEKTDALKGIGEVQAHLLNTGLSKYGTGAYETSFLYFRAALESHGLLKTTDRMSLLDEAKELEDHLYFTGIMAKMVNRCSDAVGYFDKLYRAGTDKPGVYQNLYECRSAMGEAASASKILTEGRNKFPEDPGLLFAEIN